MYRISKSLSPAWMVELSFVQAHVLKMIKWIERLTVLGVELLVEMRKYPIIQPLPYSFSQFIINFNIKKSNLSPRATKHGDQYTTEPSQRKPQVLLAGETRKKKKKIFSFKRDKEKKNVKIALKKEGRQ